MSARRNLPRLAIPIRAMMDRFAFAVLLVLAIGLLFVGKLDRRVSDAIATRVNDTLTPVLNLVSEPVSASRDLASAIGSWIALHEENARLREQNRRLLAWQATAHRLALENAALREAVNAVDEPSLPIVVTARVIADNHGPFVETLLVNAGSDAGVRDGMAAVNDEGMLGRVISVGRRSARVLLITDFNSRIPVLIEPSRDPAILAGTNSLYPELIFLPLNPRLQEGDRIVTSGSGGLLPPGLPIGRVHRLSEHGLRVAPFVDWQRVDYVRLIDYPPIESPPTGNELSGASPRVAQSQP